MLKIIIDPEQPHPGSCVGEPGLKFPVRCLGVPGCANLTGGGRELRHWLSVTSTTGLMGSLDC